MRRIIYKTRPRLFIVIMPLLGFVFSGLLFWMILSKINDKSEILAISISMFFVFVSLTSLFYFFSVKILSLTKDNLYISYFLLPYNHRISISDIISIKQRVKEVKAVYGGSWTAKYIFSQNITTIELMDKKPINIYSIGRIDFGEFFKTYKKVKRGEGKIKEQKKSMVLYLIDNLDGIFWIILAIILIGGLGYSLLKK